MERQLISVACSIPNSPEPSFFPPPCELPLLFDPSEMPLPSAPEIPELSAPDMPVAYEMLTPTTPLAMLEEALAHAQTRAREAEEKVVQLIVERDEARQLAQTLDAELSKAEQRMEQVLTETATRFIERIRVLQTSVDNLMVKNKELKAAITAKDEQLIQVQNNTRSKLAKLTISVQQYQDLLDVAEIELAESKKNKLSDDEELAGLLHRHNVFNNLYHDCNAMRGGDNAAGFRASELDQWRVFLQKLKTQDPEVFDKVRNAGMVEALLNGAHWGNGQFGRHRHGYYNEAHLACAKWLKQKGYLPSDFGADFNSCECEAFGAKSYGVEHPKL